MSQEDQRFHWVILIDDGLPGDIHGQLEAVISPFGERAFLHQSRRRSAVSLAAIAAERGLPGVGDYLLTGRIDDDDAWATSMVRAARQRAESWLEQEDRAPGLSFTFSEGLEWVMYEMLDVETLQDHGERFVHTPAIRHFSLPFISMSVFVCSHVSDGGTAMGAHSRVGERLEAEKGFATDVIWTKSPMWLCSRHKQAGSAIRKAQGPEVQLSLCELAARFGIDEKAVQRYLDEADNHQYMLVKGLVGKRLALLREWAEVCQEIEDPATAAARLPRLCRERERLSGEVLRLEENVLGDPGELA